MNATPSLDEIYRSLLDRIHSGTYRAGSRLPSCRDLAREFGSNPSTVDRALDRLVSHGLVTTVPRKGSFVASTDAAPVDTRENISDELYSVLKRAWRAGIQTDAIRTMLMESFDRLNNQPKVALVECNRRDLQHIARIIHELSGIEVQPILLDDAWGRRLDEEFDVVTTPIFHLNDLSDVVTDFDNVVELNMVASPVVLRSIVLIRDVPEITVAAPTQRGIQWMTAVVGQYYPGQINPFLVGTDSPDQLEGVEVLVTNNAAGLPREHQKKVPRVFSIDWELESRFSSTFRSRISEVIARRSARSSVQRVLQ